MHGREYRLKMAKTSVHLEFWIVVVGFYMFPPAYKRIVCLISWMTGVLDEQAGRGCGILVPGHSTWLLFLSAFPCGVSGVMGMVIGLCRL